MTPEQVALVNQTLPSVRVHTTAIAAGFYRRLFEAEPSLRALFTTDLGEQRRIFGLELEAIMSSIRDHGAFIAQAGSLGARHRRYGVHPVDYGRAGPPLLAALGAALGPEWTPEVAEAWRLAYNLTVEAMMAAGNSQEEDEEEHAGDPGAPISP